MRVVLPSGLTETRFTVSSLQRRGRFQQAHLTISKGREACSQLHTVRTCTSRLGGKRYTCPRFKIFQLREWDLEGPCILEFLRAY